MLPFYHPRVFERVNIALLDLFDRIIINRYNRDGTIRKKIRVPLTIHFSKNFADFILSTQDKPESKHTTPIMGLRMGPLERNTSGTTARTFIREIYDKNTKQMIQDARPCPWIQTYTLTSYTELIQDHFQIMEQIIPYFNPAFNTAIKEFEFANLKRDVIVELVSVSPSYNDELDREKFRSYVCDYTFKVKFDMYAPFYLATIIKQINTRISETNKPIEKITNIGIDEMTIEEYELKMNEVISVGKQLDSVVVSSIETIADNEYRKYVEVSGAEVIEMVTVPAGKAITHASISVIEPFNSNSSRVSIGIKDAPALIMPSNDSNLALSTKYEIELVMPKFKTDTNVYIHYNRGDSTVGSFEAQIRWT